MASIKNNKNSMLNSQLATSAAKMNTATSTYATISNNIAPSALYVNNSTPYYAFNTDTSSFEFLTLAVKYLNEEELDKLLSSIIDRAGQISEDISAVIKAPIKAIVRTRHVSEEFLLKYYEYLNKSDILTLHTPDITSGGYPQLALLLMNDESKSGGSEGFREPNR